MGIKKEKEETLIRLNKFLAQAGIASRREADKLIQQGRVMVNKKVVKEMGFKAKVNDVVLFDGEQIRAEKTRYVLLNKPKNFITTTKDPKNRNTVMGLISNACKERVYPVGRLDRKTTGLLLFTNDGTLAKKLTHPSNKIIKTYHVVLDKALREKDFLQIKKGVFLHEGRVNVDSISYIQKTQKKEIGIQIYLGWNRIIRRLFEKLNYRVLRLDRVLFASLTKKNLPRGKWRVLTEEEISILKRL